MTSTANDADAHTAVMPSEHAALGRGPSRLSPITNRQSRGTLLAISPVPPWPARDGMSLRVSRVLEHLALDWPIVLVRPPGGETAAENGISLTAEVNFAQAAQWMYVPSQYDIEPVVKTVRGAVEAHKPSVALLWGGMEYLRQHIPAMPQSISDRVDSMTLSSWRMLKHWSNHKDFRRRLAHFAYVTHYEFKARHASRGVVVVGEADAEVLRRFLRVKNVHVVPNGVDVSHRPVQERAPRPTVVFTGVLNYEPNVDAVMYFANEIWPSIHERLPEAIFQLVGRAPTAEILALATRPGIEIHADVRSVTDFLAQAWLAVAPMRNGCGIKNKVLEAWSVGTPAVMTPIATNGLTQAPAELLLTAEGRELSDLVADLLADSARRQRLGNLARSTAIKNFSWQQTGARISALLADVVDSISVVADA